MSVAPHPGELSPFQADFKLMCDNAMTYNRPDTVYYKLAKKILRRLQDDEQSEGL